MKAEGETTLFKLVEKWLERTPFLTSDSFDFWKAYRTSVYEMIESSHASVENNPHICPDTKTEVLKDVFRTRLDFDSLLDADRYNSLKESGERRLSHRAMQAATFIYLYREEPMMQTPYRLLSLLMDVDEQLLAWRHAHATMVHRMIGAKVGTGGSSGFAYLRATVTSRYKVFSDFFHLSTYLVPRSIRPPLPPSLVRAMSFQASLLEIATADAQKGYDGKGSGMTCPFDLPVGSPLVLPTSPALHLVQKEEGRQTV